MMPVLTELNSKWFSPKVRKKQSCLYCDLLRNNGTAHDEDCLYERARQTLKAIHQIEHSSEWDIGPFGNYRTRKEIRYFKDYYIIKSILNIFFKNYLSSTIPLDYTDKENRGVICTCSALSGNFTRHHRSCVKIKIARCLSQLFHPSRA